MQALLSQPQISALTTFVKAFQPSGHVNAANANSLKEALLAAVSSQDYSAVLVDMGKVESLDSAGLMALVAALSLSQQLGKRFALCSVSPSIRIIFELTQLDRVFEILPDAASVPSGKF